MMMDIATLVMMMLLDKFLIDPVTLVMIMTVMLLWPSVIVMITLNWLVIG